MQNNFKDIIGLLMQSDQSDLDQQTLADKAQGLPTTVPLESAVESTRKALLIAGKKQKKSMDSYIQHWKLIHFQCSFASPPLHSETLECRAPQNALFWFGLSLCGFLKLWSVRR